MSRPAAFWVALSAPAVLALGAWFLAGHAAAAAGTIAAACLVIGKYGNNWTPRI
jgi:hypothetical protein